MYARSLTQQQTSAKNVEIILFSLMVNALMQDAKNTFMLNVQNARADSKSTNKVIAMTLFVQVKQTVNVQNV